MYGSYYGFLQQTTFMRCPKYRLAFQPREILSTELKDHNKVEMFQDPMDFGSLHKKV